jgi:hypothetical protein
MATALEFGKFEGYSGKHAQKNISFAGSREFSSPMKRYSLLLFTIAGGLILVPGGILASRHMSRPFETQAQFTRHLRNEEFAAAKAMIATADRSRIPEAYWEQFRGHPPECLISPTGITYLNGKMAMILMCTDKSGHNLPMISINYLVDGNIIRVQEISHTAIPP